VVSPSNPDGTVLSSFQTSLTPLMGNDRLTAESAENIVGFRIQGRLTETDYQNVLAPEIAQGIAWFGKIGVLLQMEKFEGWTVGGAGEDLIIGPKFVSVEKLALVVDETWDEWMT
jgi:hypothetical protein